MLAGVLEQEIKRYSGEEEEDSIREVRNDTQPQEPSIGHYVSGCGGRAAGHLQGGIHEAFRKAPTIPTATWNAPAIRARRLSDAGGSPPGTSENAPAGELMANPFPGRSQTGRRRAYNVYRGEYDVNIGP